MGFNSIFYAGTTKLSQVVIDTDLDMGGNGIKSKSIVADSAVLGGARVKDGRVEHALRTFNFKFEASDEALTEPVSSITSTSAANVWVKGAIIHLPETFEPSTYKVVAKVVGSLDWKRFRVQTASGEIIATSDRTNYEADRSVIITTSGGIYEVWCVNEGGAAPVSLADLVIKGTLQTYPIVDIAPHDITVEAV
jgi:hypothetical protein